MEWCEKRYEIKKKEENPIRVRLQVKSNLEEERALLCSWTYFIRELLSSLPSKDHSTLLMVLEALFFHHFLSFLFFFLSPSHYHHVKSTQEPVEVVLSEETGKKLMKLVLWFRNISSGVK